MSIRSLQLRLTQVGVIRLGEKRISSKTGNPYPAKLETFRLTSPSREIIDTVAGLYGGQVRDWPDAPAGPEFQVITQVKELPVYVLPQRIDPNLELWGKGHRQRLCDGETERIRNVPCLCEQAAQERYRLARRPWPEDGKFVRDPRSDCKPTTRLSVILRDVSDGQWKVEAHGWNAAAELPTKATVYLALARKPVPATLRLVIRKDAVLKIQPDGSEEIESREYAVPELDFGNLFTARMALTGSLDEIVQAALDGQQLRPAIAAGPAQAEVDWLALVADAQSVADLNALKDRMMAAGVRDAAIVDAWKARGAAITAVAEVKPAETVQPVETVPIDGEVEPSPDETWAAILREAGKHGWKTSQVEARYRAQMGHDAADGNGWQLAEFLKALTGEQVTS